MATEQKKTVPKQEATYTVHELAGGASEVFGPSIMPECVIAAFKVAGIESATKNEAQKIVQNFMKKEIK